MYLHTYILKQETECVVSEGMKSNALIDNRLTPYYDYGKVMSKHANNLVFDPIMELF